MFLPDSAMEKLVHAGMDISNSQFVIGDITLELISELNHARQHITTKVGEITGLSGRRVDKIAYVCSAFPDITRNPKYGFGYYEQAYNLGDDRYDAIEFLDFFEQEYGRVLSVSEFTLVFRQHILGEPTRNVTPEERANEHIAYINRLKFLAREHENSDTILRLLVEIEDAFCERNQLQLAQTDAYFSNASHSPSTKTETVRPR